MTGTHDANENPLNFQANAPHVECVDCHNPHQARHDIDPLAVAPQIRGLAGLEGVTIEKRADNTRVYATREYEICFKCHSENYFTPPAIPRQFPLDGTGDEKLRFDSTNPSYHPVTNTVAAASIPSSYSLRPPALPGTAQIYCSNCHTPHGSGADPLKNHLLKAEYYTAPGKPAVFSENDYQLCFICHDQDKLWLTGSEQPFPQHTLHVQEQRIPCAVCHDPHGVPTNNAHLINFDLRTVSPTTPVPAYMSSGIGRGCTVSCHTTGSPDPFTHNY
jgi:formate-dependent nitrite reductase cytochrome c552 subunit